MLYNVDVHPMTLPLPILDWFSNCPKLIYAYTDMTIRKKKNYFFVISDRLIAFRIFFCLLIFLHSEFWLLEFLVSLTFVFDIMTWNYILAYSHERFVIVADFLHMNIKFGINEWLQCAITLYVC